MTNHWSGGDKKKSKCKHRKACKSLSPAWCVDCKLMDTDIPRMETFVRIGNILLEVDDD